MVVFCIASLMNGWFSSYNRVMICKVCYTKASVHNVRAFIAWMSICFVWGSKSVTQRRLTKTGCDQGVRRGSS